MAEKFKILVSDKLSEEGLNILKKEKDFAVDVITGLKPEELKEKIKDYDALIVRSSTKVTKDILENAKKLKIIGRAGVGLDNVDLDAATAKGIIAMNTPGGNTISTAEHTMSLILALSRSISEAHASLKKGEWLRSKFMGVELCGKTLGIIGLGRIGREVAKRAASFSMKIVAYDPFISQAIAQELGVKVVNLEELFKTSDYITVHVPSSDETKGMISSKEFSLMKKTARVINCARGGIIDEKALEEALKTGKIAGAALDVFEQEPPSGDNPLLKLNNIVLTPHLGASTEEAQVNVAIEIANQVSDALKGNGIRNAANYPSLTPELSSIIEPFINLSEKLGLLVSQLVEGRTQKINITYSGSIADYDTVPLTLSIVKGILYPMLKDTVNFVNSLSLAKERGISVQEAKVSGEKEFANQISVEVTTDKEAHKVSGTSFGKNLARIVKIDDYYVEAIPSGYMLVIGNWDKPGIIGALGTLLGKHKINIAGMTFGRTKPGGKSISVLNVDSLIASDILKKIEKLENILSVKLIKL